MLALRLILALVLAGGGFAAGWRVHDWKDGAAAAKAAVHTIQVVQRQAAVAQTIAVRQQAAQDHARIVTRTLIQKVPVYVTAKADAGCVVPDGFRLLHDAAAADMPPAAEPPGKSADAPSGLALSAVAETVSANYGICHQTAERLKGWQDWWAQVSRTR